MQLSMAFNIRCYFISINKSSFQHCWTPGLRRCIEDTHALPRVPLPLVTVLAIAPSFDRVLGESKFENHRTKSFEQAIHHLIGVLQNHTRCGDLEG